MTSDTVNEEIELEINNFSDRIEDQDILLATLDNIQPNAGDEKKQDNVEEMTSIPPLSDFVGEKPNLEIKTEISTPSANVQSFSANFLEGTNLNYSQLSLLQDFEGSMYSRLNSATAIENFGGYLFDSYIKGFDQNIDLNFSSNIYVPNGRANKGALQISADTKPNIIEGSDGNDVLYGTSGNDIIRGNSFSAVTPVNITHTILNPTPVAGDLFARNVSISGNYTIVPAHRDDTGAVDSGAVYIFDITTGGLVHTLNNPTASANDFFGFSVSIDGNFAIVGALGDDDGGTFNAGAAYIYDVTTGALLHTLNNPTPEIGDFYGRGVAITGNYAIVGAYQDNTGATDAGSIYIYDVTTGALLHTLNNPTPVVNDRFGYTVAIEGNYAIVGAHLDDSGAIDSGVAYIYDVTTGTLLHTLNNPSPGTNDFFGLKVAIDTNFAVVGVYNDDGAANDSGSVYVFDITTGALVLTIENPIPAPNDGFGASVAIDGNYVVVGANGDDTEASDSGSVYIFDVTTGNLVFTLNNPTPIAGGGFGRSVAIDGGNLVVGANNDDMGAANEGIVYTFQIDFDDADTLIGGDGDDILYGLEGADILYGDDGFDRLFGGENSDRFVLEAASVFNDVDRIEDFNLDEQDVIDISDVLVGYDRGISDINDFVRFIDSGADTTMEIDADGAVGGANFQAAALIVGGAGLTQLNLETSGQLDGVV